MELIDMLTGTYQACVAEFFRSGQLLLLSWNSASIFPHVHWLHGW